MLRTVRFLLRKEFLQIGRDRTMLLQLFLMPMIQLLILANAATFEVRSARMYVVDRDHSAASRGVVDRFVASGRFVPTAGSPSTAKGDSAMLDRRVDMILVVPEGFERDLVREQRGSVQLVLNAEDGVAAGVTQSYAREVLANYSAELSADVTPSLATIDARAETPPQRGRPMIEVSRRAWYNAELQYRDYMIPGILVQLVTMIGTLLTAMNIVREKEAGTLDQLNVTPVTRPAFIAAKLIPLWTIALMELSFGLLVGRFAFDVPIRGNIALVFGAAAIYLVAALGIGLWISTFVETQQQAMFVSFFIMMIYLLMSGLFTPIRSMPVWAQWMAKLNPVMHFTQLMRAVLLKGAGLADIARPLMILSGFGVFFLTMAVRQYRKRSA